ncbi:MAG: SDR family NAD(P)-dependent oxidoreductase [Myxococcales bacterium]|nr:SDR family NAD(P)-dependent oxidoreductase [Myxococcales bacterium]
MSNELRFDGKVVIVTGAGQGLGRAHALLFASRGAKVLVNDLGGTHTGEGRSSAAADRVVEEIRAAGGTAVANYDSVEDGARIVQAALDAFGRIDVVVNNAGILRDVSYAKMTDADWDLVYRVHVRGAHAVTHAAWPHLREQKYGRIVFTSSAAGIYGNFGQVNYAMAKLGLVGMMHALAIEGRKNNVLVNAIAPIAGSRMTETVLPRELVEALRPEYVSALVAWLCHESCEETGGLFEVGGGFFAKLRWNRTEGVTWRIGRTITPEMVRDQWKRIVDFSKSTFPSSVAESMAPILRNVEAGPSRGGNQYIDVDEALGWEAPPVRSSYDERDVALYALGVGAGADATDPRELGLVYEMHGGGFHPLPTMTAAIAVQQIMKAAMEGRQAPGLRFGLDRILHGEQYTEVLFPLPPRATLEHRAKIKAIWDKGKGAVVVNEVRSYDEQGELVAINEVSTFVRGAGGWGGERGPAGESADPPERAPDAVVREATSPDQALLYRLSGDVNPLHVDPGFARAFGFERPILHGLCTFGFAGRHLIRAFCGGDPRLLRSIRVRFAEPVYPGETLVTEMWKVEPLKIVFRTRVQERDKVVLANGIATLHPEVPQRKKRPAPAAAAAAAEPTSADVFGGIARFMARERDVATRAQTVYLFRLSQPDSEWTIDTREGRVRPGAPERAECTLELTDADFMAMVAGKADPMKLFTSGRLRISGNVMASQKLDFLRKVDPNDVLEAMRERTGGAGAPAAGTAGTIGAAPQAVTSEVVFRAIGAWFAKNPELARKAGVVYLFKLSNPDSAWTLDTKEGVVRPGMPDRPECTLELSDADFLAMVQGQADPMKLFTSGRLRISGNVMASQKLEFLTKLDRNEVAAAMGAPASSAPSAAAASAGASAQAAARQPVAPRLFEALEQRLRAQPALGAEVGATVRFVVGEQSWTVDFPAGRVERGGSAAAATVIGISDEALEEIARGKLGLQQAFQRGRMRVDGDVAPARRLGVLVGLL